MSAEVPAVTKEQIEHLADSMLALAASRLGEKATVIVMVADGSGDLHTTGMHGHPLALLGLMSLKASMVMVACQRSSSAEPSAVSGEAK